MSRHSSRCSSRFHPQDSDIPQSPLLFLGCINDLMENLHSNPKLFADDTSLFSTVTDEALSNSYLSEDQSKINDCDYKRKMSFNPDRTKTPHGVVFGRKRNIQNPPITFENLPVKSIQSHKHLGLTLDSKLIFTEYISLILSIVKVARVINLKMVFTD